MKGMGKAGALLLALVAVPASAGTLYRCVGADGVSSYVNKRISGAQCKVFSQYDRRFGSTGLVIGGNWTNSEQHRLHHECESLAISPMAMQRTA